MQITPDLIKYLEKLAREVCPRCNKSLFRKKGNVLYCPDTEGCGFTKPAPKKK